MLESVWEGGERVRECGRRVLERECVGRGRGVESVGG